MNKLDNIKIAGIEVYHAKPIRNNEFYYEHFVKQGMPLEKCKKFIEGTLGRKQRYVIDKDSDENTLTMAIKASQKVLQKLNLTGDDIDMVCMCSLSAEYKVPPTALKLHAAIGGSDHAVCYDMNASCISMVFAFDQVNRMMSTSDKLNRVLLVGSEYMTYMANPQDLLFYSCFGDASCAIILEKTKGNSRLIDTSYFIRSQDSKNANGPKCGYSHVLSSTPEEIRYQIEIPDVGYDVVKVKLEEFLQANNYAKEDIDIALVSQFSPEMLKPFYEVGFSKEKVPYIGDKYGYTGCTSPFITMYEAQKANKIKRGDIALLWTLGFASQFIYQLIEF